MGVTLSGDVLTQTDSSLQHQEEEIQEQPWKAAERN
jgi:hypothetical protein